MKEVLLGFLVCSMVIEAVGVVIGDTSIILIGGILLLATLLIVRMVGKRKEEEFLSSLENKSWIFPIDELQKKAQKEHLGRIFSEERLTQLNRDRLKNLVEAVLSDKDIPSKYYEDYTTDTALEKYHSEIYQKEKRAQIAEKEALIRKTRMEEQELEREYCRYVHCTGQDKSLCYCQERIAYYRSIIKHCNERMNSIISERQTLYRSTKEKEIDWALQGGIASGIAGSAAGVSQALDAQSRNVGIRQRNAELEQSIAKVTAMRHLSMQNQRENAEKKLEYWLSEEEKAATLLTTVEDQEWLLSYLDMSVSSTHTSITNAISMKIRVDPTNKNLKINKSIPAVIDGSIKVNIMCDGRNVGSTAFSLPYRGLASSKEFDCICLIDVPLNKYNVEFAPVALWLSEK